MVGLRRVCLRLVLGKIVLEFERGVRVLFSKPAENIAFIISTPLWLAFFILTLRGYGVIKLSSIDLQLFLWVAYAFSLYTTWLWTFGHGIMDEGYDGVLEYVLAGGEDLLTHFIGWGLSLVTYELMDLVVIAGSFAILFNTRVSLVNPPLLALSLVLVTLELLFISVIYSMLVIKLRSNWVITNIIQFILPTLGGLIPGEVNNYVEAINKYSPIAYPVILMRESALGINEINVSITTQLAYSLLTIVTLGALAWVIVDITTARLRHSGQLSLY
ncbi:hypothetical protein [Caldivirga sp.]|uniref:hypothetical protein n=1 Tax=Caldivirga sp. TaxID=2080243 RepID=UPI003D0EEC24